MFCDSGDHFGNCRCINVPVKGGEVHAGGIREVVFDEAGKVDEFLAPFEFTDWFIGRWKDTSHLKVAISGDFAKLKTSIGGGARSRGGYKIPDDIHKELLHLKWLCIVAQMRKILFKPYRGRRWNRRVEKLMFRWGYRKDWN